MQDDSILFIAMEFVPLNLGGVFRPLRFVNGLAKNGIKPVVLTFADDDNLRKVHHRFDHELLLKLDKNIKTYSVPLGDMDKFKRSRLRQFRHTFFNISDNFYKAWRENIFKVLPEIIEQHKPKAVFVTCPPFSAAELGSHISKKFDLPLILDMRDAWSKIWVPVGSYFHYLIKKNVERRVFDRATAIITVTPRLKSVFQETHPRLNANKFKLIYNGFDFELPQKIGIASRSIDCKGSIDIGYIGAFYYSPEAQERMLLPWWKKRGHRMLQYSPVKEDWLYRSPYFFFKALNILFRRRPEWKAKIKFHHIGDTPEWLSAMAADFDLTDNLVLHGFQTLEKALILQQTFDLLLATSEKVIGNEHFCLPSKLFTYLKSGKPVLGFVTRGIQYDFLKNSGAAIINDPDHIDGWANALENIVAGGYQAELNIPYLRQFANSVAIDELINLVRCVIDNKKKQEQEKRAE